MATLPNLIKNGCAAMVALRNDSLRKAPVSLEQHSLKANKNYSDTVTLYHHPVTSYILPEIHIKRICLGWH